jgi:VWFA-related protein
LVFLWLISSCFTVYGAGKIFPKIDKIDLSRFPDVSAYVSFFDEYGHTIRNIDPEKMDVSISINVVPDRIFKLKEPLSVCLMLDKSGSMRDNMSHLKQAAHRFTSLLDKTDKLEILAFDQKLRPVHSFSYDKRGVKSKISKLYGKGSTALYDALYSATRRIHDQPGNRIIILITDGKDQIRDGSGPMSRHSLDETIHFVRASGVPVITIGLGNRSDTETLKAIAHYTGGKYYFAPSKYELEGLYETIARNLTSQFKIQISSPYPVRDGSWRKLTVQGQHGLDTGHSEKWYSVNPDSSN